MCNGTHHSPDPLRTLFAHPSEWWPTSFGGSFPLLCVLICHNGDHLNLIEMQMNLTDHGVPDWMDFEGLDTLLDDLACDFSLFDNFAGDASYRQSPSSGHSVSVVRNMTQVKRSSGKARKITVVKSSKRGAHSGSKLKRSQVAKPISDSDSSIKETETRVTQSTVAEFKLLVFPSFEKCDSLVYFPHTFSRHLNSGDLDSISKMMNSYLHKACSVRFCGMDDGSWTYHRMIEMFQFANEVHPDSLMCVHNTKVEDNNIFSTMYFKFTDSKELNAMLRRTTRDPTKLHMIADRSNSLKESIAANRDMKEEERHRQSLLVDTEEDLVVYGRMDLQITFDAYSKKVTSISFNANLTSVAPSRTISESI